MTSCPSLALAASVALTTCSPDPGCTTSAGYVRPPSEGRDALVQPPVISHLEYCNTLRPTKVLPECITPSNPAQAAQIRLQSLVLATMRQTALAYPRTRTRSDLQPVQPHSNPSKKRATPSLQGSPAVTQQTWSVCRPGSTTVERAPTDVRTAENTRNNTRQ